MAETRNHDVIAQFVRDELPSNIRDQLLADEHIDKLRNGLLEKKRNIEAQLALQRSRDLQRRIELIKAGDNGFEWIAYQAGQADWRQRAIFFLSNVEDKLADVSLRITERNRKRMGIDADSLLDAILAHHAEIGDDEAHDADLALWRMAGVDHDEE